MNITICGGGNLGHVCAGFFAAHEGCDVSLLTRHPEKWSHRLEINDLNGKTYHGSLKVISADPCEVIPGADMVLICLPGFAIHEMLQSIAPCLNEKTWVGTVVSSTGFFFEAFKLLSKKQPLFGFQRVPFISRIVNYGHTAELKGYKSSLSVAVEQTEDKETIRKTLEVLFQTPTILLGSYYEVSLSNSNPLLHTSRLYTLWNKWASGMSYDTNPLFYADWTIEASQLLIDMDLEFQTLLRTIGLKEGCIPPVLDYYESYDAESLTKKISSIPAFQGISSPMVINKFGKFEPDFTSRYFTEDFPYGMRFIVEVANKYNLDIPKINHVYSWGSKMIERNEDA